MKTFMTLKPLVSEKSYRLSQERNTYVFKVPTDASKQAVAAAVTAQFKVTVTSVNVANRLGKVKRTVRKGGRPVRGQRASERHAYVTLKAGENIPVFASLETDEAAAETKAKQTTKKETK